MIIETDRFSFFSFSEYNSVPRYDNEYVCLVRPKGTETASLTAVKLKFIRDSAYSEHGEWYARKPGGWTQTHPWEVVIWCEEYSE